MNPYQINLNINQKNNRKKEELVVLPKDDLSLFSEISYSESDVYRSLYAYAQNPDPVVRAKGLYIYRDMAEDDQIKACLEIRKQARLSTNWMIHSVEEGNPDADLYADFITYVLNTMEGTFSDNLYNIYSAIDYGFSITEKVLKLYEDGPYKGKIGLKALKTREPYNYDFKIDLFGTLEGIVFTGAGISLNRLNTVKEQDLMKQKLSTSPLRLEADKLSESSVFTLFGTNENPFPRDKFIIYSYNMQFSNWYGRSDLLAAFRSWMIKKHIMKFWNIWLERYASPFIWATYKNNAGVKKETLDEVDSFLKNLSAKQSLRVSDAFTLNAIQSSTAGGDTYEKAIEAHNRYIAHALLCPNLLGITGEQSVGSYALGQKQFGAFVWALDKLGRDTSETIVFEQIIKPLILLNFPNVNQDLFPTFKFESVEDSSIEVRSRIVAILAQNGFINPDESWVREFLTLPKIEKDIILNSPVSRTGFLSSSNPNNLNPDPNPNPNPNPDPDSSSKFQERKETNFEKKIKIKEFKTNLNNTQSLIIKALTAPLEEIRDNLIRIVQKKDLINVDSIRDVNKLTINIGPFKQILKMWLVKVHFDSKLQSLEELKRGGLDIEITKKFANIPFYDWEPLPPKEAIDFFNKKVSAKIINKEGNRVLLTLASQNEIPYYDQKAFMISGVVKEDILNSAKNIILNGIKRQDDTGAIKDLKDMFNKYLEQGQMVDDELLSPHRLQTIVRTNMTEAINEGRRNLYEDPEINNFVQYFQYSAILDDRTTDYCECMDGKIFRIEDISEFNPPAHYNCRSFTVPITQAELNDMILQGNGIEVSEPCPDRATTFTLKKSDPLFVPKGVSNLKIIPKEGDPEPSNIEDELSRIIVKCPYSNCASEKIAQTGYHYNVAEFLCEKCGLPFRVSNLGDIYLFDAGLDQWIRTTHGVYPEFFKEK